MKTFTIASAVALLAAFAQAAPTLIQIQIDTGVTVSTAKITFQGAPADVAFFTQDFPVDGQTKPITNKLSISHIKNENPNAKCTFYGVDGSVTVVRGATTCDVGPPQTQTSGFCEHFVQH